MRNWMRPFQPTTMLLLFLALAAVSATLLDPDDAELLEFTVLPALYGADYTGPVYENLTYIECETDPSIGCDETTGGLVMLAFPTTGLNGVIPSELGSFSGLKYLLLGGNNLTGTIPVELESFFLTEGAIISVAHNRLSGAIPLELVQNAILAACGLSQPQGHNCFDCGTADLVNETNVCYNNLRSGDSCNKEHCPSPSPTTLPIEVVTTTTTGAGTTAATTSSNPYVGTASGPYVPKAESIPSKQEDFEEIGLATGLSVLGVVAFIALFGGVFLIIRRRHMKMLRAKVDAMRIERIHKRGFSSASPRRRRSAPSENEYMAVPQLLDEARRRAREKALNGEGSISDDSGSLVLVQTSRMHVYGDHKPLKPKTQHIYDDCSSPLNEYDTVPNTPSAQSDMPAEYDTVPGTTSASTDSTLDIAQKNEYANPGDAFIK